ncbi:ILV2 [Candida margitis]|uniref:ILV2 n=1 Tax=Candida margitis TaxID=1775924 RepID=UPI002226A674|nr:ILV2 [Candida margitis]KAI5950562.1 ILV2 [Candida margitis]
MLSRHLSRCCSKRTTQNLYLAVKSQTRSISKINHHNAAQVASRPQPSPAFNISDVESSSPPQQKTSLRQQPQRRSEQAMDDSFIGLTGGEIFHEMMMRHNVDTVFGYAGGAILPVFDAIYNSEKFKFVLPRHEQGAGHMAEGYARASGKPGIVLVTSGPGATNVVTPMADALMDGVPLIVFTGQVPTTAIGTDAFQEADVIGISRSCTKWNVMVKNVAELPRRINEAFEIATTGRPGPVLVDLPKDVTASILRESIPINTTLPSNALSTITRKAVSEFTTEAIKRSADILNKAKKPIIYCGGGILNHEDGPKLLKELADKANIPVTTTIQGLGAFDQRDPKSLDFLGMHGSAAANTAMQNADCIIALGARFDDRVTGNIAKFAPEAKLAAAENRGGILHFEISPKNINKVVEATEAVEGDVTANLRKFIPLVNQVESRPEWFKKIDEWKEKYPYAYQLETPGSKIKPQTLIKEISHQSSNYGKDVYVTTGVGQHQMWAAQHWTWTKPRTMITSGGLGTMGYGLPAAIGAQVAKPDAIVIDIDGDASFNMTLTELSSAVQAGAPIKVCVLNNEEQGMVTQWQSLFYEHRYSHTHQANPDFMKLAEAMGVKGIRISTQEEMKSGVKEFLDCQEPVLLEVMVEKKVPVLPMVPGGNALDDFILWDSETEKQQNALRKQRTGDYFQSNKVLNQRIAYNLPLDANSQEREIQVVITISQKYDRAKHAELDGFKGVVLPEAPNLLLYLQGGPGFGCTVPTSYSGITKVLLDEGYQIVWMDQRGTGGSTPIDYRTLSQNLSTTAVEDQLEAILQFRADSIVRDAETIRKHLIGDAKWSTLGQSYGGFCSFTYLSLYPESLKQVFITGGVPPIGFDVDSVYTQTYKRTKERNVHYYRKYPQDVARVVEICQYLKSNNVTLPDGGHLSVERFQQLGLSFGGFGGTDQVHTIVTNFWQDLKMFNHPTVYTLTSVQNAMSFDTNVIYALFQEAIYCSGKMKSNWSADRLRYISGNEKFQFNTDEIYFTGEMVYKSMFDDYAELRQFKSLAYALHEFENWSTLYNIDKLQTITWKDVPIVATTYYADQYVDFELTRQVKQQYLPSCNLRQYITNDLFHNGLRVDPDRVLTSMFKLLDNGFD